MTDNSNQALTVKQQRSLADRDIATAPAIGRRRLLAMTVIGVGAAAGGTPAHAADPQRSGVTDRDDTPNPSADQPGAGRGFVRGAHSGLTDADQGAISDPQDNGRGPSSQRLQGTTDRDEGTNADPADLGRGPSRAQASGLTDRDDDPQADPPGDGRGARRASGGRG
jgi:hypothetical protein